MLGLVPVAFVTVRAPAPATAGGQCVSQPLPTVVAFGRRKGIRLLIAVQAAERHSMTTTMTFALSPALTTQLAAQPNSDVFALPVHAVVARSGTHRHVTAIFC